MMPSDSVTGLPGTEVPDAPGTSAPVGATAVTAAGSGAGTYDSITLRDATSHNVLAAARDAFTGDSATLRKEVFNVGGGSAQWKSGEALELRVEVTGTISGAATINLNTFWV